MAMLAGTVTVDVAGVVVGTGMALAIFNALLATTPKPDPAVPPAWWPTPDLPPPKDWPSVAAKALIGIKQSLVPTATGVAAGVVAHIVANAEVTVRVAPADAGLQNTPNPNNPDTPTKAPGATVTLATKGTVS